MWLLVYIQQTASTTFHVESALVDAYNIIGKTCCRAIIWEGDKNIENQTCNDLSICRFKFYVNRNIGLSLVNFMVLIHYYLFWIFLCRTFYSPIYLKYSYTLVEYNLSKNSSFNSLHKNDCFLLICVCCLRRLYSLTLSTNIKYPFFKIFILSRFRCILELIEQPPFSCLLFVHFGVLEALNAILKFKII